MKIYFAEERAPYDIVVQDENYAVCTRKLNRRQDAGLLWHEVDMNTYCTFTQAYEANKNELIYTIIDFRNNKRNRHNLIFNPYDFKNVKDCNQLLKDLNSGDTKLSERNIINLNIIN